MQIRTVVLAGALAFLPGKASAQCSGWWLDVGGGVVQWVEYCQVTAETLYYSWFSSPGRLADWPQSLMLHTADEVTGSGWAFPGCGDAAKDMLISEYLGRNVGITPLCHGLHTSGGSAHFTWSELTQHAANDHYPLALIWPFLWDGLEATRSEYNRGGITITSGYRCPVGNERTPGAAAQSRHQWGTAADMVSAGHPWNEAEWTELCGAAQDAGASMIEPYALDPSHCHAQWGS